MSSSITDRSGGPLVSIVMPAYDRARYIAETIDSVLAQTLTSWELVVSDDGSRDGTADIAQRYADRDDRVRVIRAPNGGVATARNRGCAAISPSSDYVILLDSDDLWERDALQVLVGALESDPALVAAHGLARAIDEEGRSIPGDDLEAQMRARRGRRNGVLVPRGPDESTTFAEMSQENWILTPGTLLLRRSTFERVGEFDPRVEPADDWDYAIRVSRIGDIGFVDLPVLRWRRHTGSISNTSSRWRRAYFEVLEKMQRCEENTDEQAAVARATMWAVCCSSAQDARASMASGKLGTGSRQLGKAIVAWRCYVRGRHVHARRGVGDALAGPRS